MHCTFATITPTPNHQLELNGQPEDQPTVVAVETNLQTKHLTHVLHQEISSIVELKKSFVIMNEKEKDSAQSGGKKTVGESPEVAESTKTVPKAKKETPANRCRRERRAHLQKITCRSSKA
jgi:hypothetical protein